MSKETYVPTLLKLFRQFGYEGVTLSKISQATGLGKASLYHHFPGGKAEMAEAALTHVNQWLETSILQILNGEEIPIAKFQSMCKEANYFFNEGQNSCLLAALVLAQSSDDLFHSQISLTFSRWIEAIAKVLITAGLDETLAKERGEDAMIAIQGALILSHGLRDFAPFQRIIKQLPQQLCRDIQS
ncbi:TetR/AcrR family transcriptional regulator [Anabaena sp. PCC 7108]|uniref:TetR/AcrR family transcriptional regulator n=1 Tax=Anabaena sp. PCC 7108 TaxID=163908 RepID=UPI00034CE8C7|nr:TetR/AcrR family transcriptional regulator [Anabaena sp. PCC 7108]